MTLFFEEVPNVSMRAAYKKIYAKMMHAKTLDQKKRYWKHLNKLSEWERMEGRDI